MHEVSKVCLRFDSFFVLGNCSKPWDLKLLLQCAVDLALITNAMHLRLVVVNHAT